MLPYFILVMSALLMVFLLSEEKLVKVFGKRDAYSLVILREIRYALFIIFGTAGVVFIASCVVEEVAARNMLKVACYLLLSILPLMWLVKAFLSCAAREKRAKLYLKEMLKISHEFGVSPDTQTTRELIRAVRCIDAAYEYRDVISWERFQKDWVNDVRGYLLTLCEAEQADGDEKEVKES